jgi:PemK-like, MazF-like toxin of type II toxin-antitoxin system
MATGGWRGVLGRLASVALREGARSLQRADPVPRRRARAATPPPAARRSPTIRPPDAAGAGRGDRAGGRIGTDYRPHDDGRPDPGEVVWAWVPYEEDDGRGKDRPVLVVARDGAVLLGLMLSSKDHDLDAADEARHGRHWVDVGTGAWDRQGRPSEARVDRVLRLDPADVRREGAALDRARFDEVVAEVRRVQGW